MSLLSRIFRPKNPADSMLRLGLGFESLPAAASPSGTQPPAADTPTVTMEAISPFGNDVQMAMLARASPHSPGAVLFNRGELIGGMFRVENILAGGMGTVYICRQLKYDDYLKAPDAPKFPVQMVDPSSPDLARFFDLKPTSYGA